MSPAAASPGAVRARVGGGATPAAPAAPAADAPDERDRWRAGWAEQDRRALLALVRAYPVGAAVRFRAHLPVLSPRWWRQLAATSPWGLRAGDPLEVVGYGAAQGVPEALLVRRSADGQGALVFPPELAPPAAPPVEEAVPDRGRGAARAAPGPAPSPGPGEGSTTRTPAVTRSPPAAPPAWPGGAPRSEEGVP